MQLFVDELIQQAKRTLISPIAKNPPRQLTLGGTTADHADTFKMLGVHVSLWLPQVDTAHGCNLSQGRISDALLKAIQAHWCTNLRLTACKDVTMPVHIFNFIYVKT